MVPKSQLHCAQTPPSAYVTVRVFECMLYYTLNISSRSFFLKYICIQILFVDLRPLFI